MRLATLNSCCVTFIIPKFGMAESLNTESALTRTKEGRWSPKLRRKPSTILSGASSFIHQYINKYQIWETLGYSSSVWFAFALISAGRSIFCVKNSWFTSLRAWPPREDLKYLVFTERHKRFETKEEEEWGNFCGVVRCCGIFSGCLWTQRVKARWIRILFWWKIKERQIWFLHLSHENRFQIDLIAYYCRSISKHFYNLR